MDFRDKENMKMMKRLKVVGGIVEEVILTPEEEAAVIAEEEAAAIARAQAAIPKTVSMRQARLALLGAGLLSQVNDAIAAMAGIEGEAARIEWQFATEVKRSSPLVSSLSGALWLTDEQLDALFTQAAML